MKKDRIQHCLLYILYLYQKLRRKTPILNITTKNKIVKGNGRIDPEEHKLRIYNRENVPIIPELVIPSF